MHSFGRADQVDRAALGHVKQDLHARGLGRCLLLGDAGMCSTDHLVELSRGLGRHVLAVPIRRAQRRPR